MLGGIIAVAVFAITSVGVMLYKMFFRKKKPKRPPLNMTSMVGISEMCAFDFPSYKFLEEQANTKTKCNLTRVWLIDPLWEPGSAWYGKEYYPYKKIGDKYDLTQWNDEYWTNVRKFVETARQNGIIVIITIFDKCGHKYCWDTHCYNAKNNLQGYFTDQYALFNESPVSRYVAETLVGKLMETVGSYDNIIYEYVNEGRTSDCEKWLQMMKDIVEVKHGKAGYTLVSGCREGYSAYFAPHMIKYADQMNGSPHYIYSTDGGGGRELIGRMKEMITKARNEKKHIEFYFDRVVEADGSLNAEVKAVLNSI